MFFGRPIGERDCFEYVFAGSGFFGEPESYLKLRNKKIIKPRLPF